MDKKKSTKYAIVLIWAIATTVVLLISAAVGFAQAPFFTRVLTGEIANDLHDSFSNCWGDFDNDGDQDLFVTTSSAGQSNLLYFNNGNGTFTKITEGDIVVDEGRSYSCTAGDYDNDGDLDIFVANSDGQNNFLYSNNGNGTFTRILNGAVVNDGGDSQGCSWGDYDNDGDLDIFVANGSDQNNFLYSNNGNGTFTKITAGIIVNDAGNSKGCSWADYDNDGDVDLFIANFGDNFLYANNGNGTFTKVTEGEIVTDGGKSQGGSWGDYDNDGDLDLFVANRTNVCFFYSNNGNGTFTRITTGDIVTDLYNSRGSSWGDYDNDGDLDLFVCNASDLNNVLYSNNNNGTFNKIVFLNDGGISEGCSWCDYDKDGDLDLFVCNGENQTDYLYKNNGNANKWINIKCIGTTSNASAIGTKVKVKATINLHSVWQLNEISGMTGGGYGGQNSLNAEFGLGTATNIEQIRVEWPSGNVQILDGGGLTSSNSIKNSTTNQVQNVTSIPVNQFLTITEEVAFSATLTLVVNPLGSGSTNPAVGVHNYYEENKVVNLTATPAVGYSFSYWTGDVANPNSASTTVTMNGNKTVIANFIQSQTYNLTMAANPAAGGTTVPSTGVHTYNANAVVNISAVPADGYQFVNWSGDVANPNSAATTVTMNNHKQVTANFQQTVSGMIGDVDGDNEVNSTDALIILTCDVALDVSQYCPMNCGDVNEDGLVNSTDALIILTHDVGLQVPFPIGETGCPGSVAPCLGCNPDLN